MAGKGSGFGSYTFHHIAIAADGIYIIIKKIKTRLVITCGKMFLGYGKANTIGKTLS